MVPMKLSDSFFEKVAILLSSSSPISPGCNKTMVPKRSNQSRMLSFDWMSKGSMKCVYKLVAIDVV